MPIHPSLRHLYRGPAWRAIRERILARANNKCERCGKPNGKLMWVTRHGFWYDQEDNTWRNDQGADSAYNWPSLTKLAIYLIRCVLTVAHLNHNPHDNSDQNLQALCQHCHLKHDKHFHYANARRSRAARFGQMWLTEEIQTGVNREERVA